jgi:hypothetical protein
LELAQALLELCGGDAEKRSALLDTLVAVVPLTVDEQGRNRPRAVPVEFLMARLLYVEPDWSELAALLAELAASGRLSVEASNIAAERLWDYAAGSGAMTLPVAKQAPAQPQPPPLQPRRSRIGVSGSQAANLLAEAIEDVQSKSMFSKLKQDGFFQDLNAERVEILEDGFVARHLDDTGEDMCGLVMSCKPLTPSRAGLYFEIEVMETRGEEMPDGLTLGVTLTPPNDVTEVPRTAEHVPNTWTVGYDGQMWDPKEGALFQVDWDPRTLQSGDIVGILITQSEGELLVFRNGDAICPGPRGIPVTGGEPLYAVVDLLGAARAVRWRPGAVPPM